MLAATFSDNATNPRKNAGVCANRLILLQCVVQQKQSAERDVDFLNWIFDLHPECKIAVGGAALAAGTLWRQNVKQAQRIWILVDQIIAARKA